MNILALDASANCCSVAVNRNGSLFYGESFKARAHAQELLPLVQKQLNKASITLQDINAIAFGAGPGSFTGLRIALSMAQGLGFGLEVPLIPISSLLATAVNSSRSISDEPLLVSVLDARMNELYWAAYKGQVLNVLDDSDQAGASVMNVPIGFVIPDEIEPPQLHSIETTEVQLQSLLDRAGPNTHIVGPGVSLLSEAVVSRFAHADKTVEPTALAIAVLAVSAFDEGRIVSPDEAELCYLRNSVSWNKRKRIRPNPLA